jgi:hypothetical protein
MRHLLWPTDIVSSSADTVWIRTAAASDLEALSEYFGNLSQLSRYNRFMGAVSNFSKIAFDCLKHGWKPRKRLRRVRSPIAGSIRDLARSY